MLVFLHAYFLVPNRCPPRNHVCIENAHGHILIATQPPHPSLLLVFDQLHNYI